MGPYILVCAVGRVIFWGFPFFTIMPLSTVKWDSRIKKFFWLSENGDLTCGNITKVPKLGKINFMKLISCEI